MKQLTYNEYLKRLAEIEKKKAEEAKAVKVEAKTEEVTEEVTEEKTVEEKKPVAKTRKPRATKKETTK